jgi:hypothetical protein
MYIYIKDVIMNLRECILEALKTKCQTPETNYNINIQEDKIDISLNLPFDLELNESEAKLLEDNLHNAIELVLARYFNS